MSPANPKAPDTPERKAVLVPLVIVLLVVAVAAVFAWSHLAVKGPGPERTQAQIATGQGPPERGPYSLDDFTEPKSR